jgi:DNA-binding NarL/FixJ family response regulator
VKLDTYNMPGRLADATELVLYRITRRVMQNVTTAAEDIDAVLWYDENAVHYSISPLPLFDRTQGWRLLPLLEEYGHTINANIGVQSEENISTVYLTIPDAVFQSSEAHILPLVVQAKPNVEASVLVISSDSAFLDHVTKMLAGLVRVVPFQTDNSDELPRQLKLHAPQILVLDLVIPSDELSVVIRETNVILLSPYPDETFARQALRQGVMGFVPRARAHTELLSAVQTVMHHERYISAALVLGNDETPSTKPLNLDVLLTRREREIMELILQDKTHADIAAQLVISPRTVEKHRANMMQKLALDTHTELILFAMRYGLMPPG